MVGEGSPSRLLDEPGFTTYNDPLIIALKNDRSGRPVATTRFKEVITVTSISMLIIKPFKLLFKILFSRLFFVFVAGIAAVLLVRAGNQATSSDTFCESCHVHPQATSSWKLSTHYGNRSGVVVHCVECHLPPGGLDYVWEKTRLGIRDVWSTLFKDTDALDWDAKSTLEHARTHTFKDACLYCHQNLFTLGLSREGDEAHLHYSQHADELRCINCHLHVGHYDKNAGKNSGFGLAAGAAEAEQVFDAPAVVAGFVDFTETIPGTSVAFDMVALPGATFSLGSAAGEEGRRPDEGPAATVAVSSFWIARTEVTWKEYEAFYRQTASEGRSSDVGRAEGGLAAGAAAEIDAVTGATPPWGNPGQGWGRGDRPAITMTHHAAMTYCRWLSQVTGRRYRLPTEAEWEYACRGGTKGPYFFAGQAGDFSDEGFWRRLFGGGGHAIDEFVNFAGNGGARTAPASQTIPNPFGLLNMAGNVREFCLDWYAPDAYAAYQRRPGGGGPVGDPRGPAAGTEHVVRGGSFKSDPADVRSAARDYTRTVAWLMTDPQMPKSIWWYSDCNDVGFRVVCEYDEEDATETRSE